jgi:hypothetical protein
MRGGRGTVPLVAKFCDHLPLYRQQRVFRARRIGDCAAHRWRNG